MRNKLKIALISQYLPSAFAGGVSRQVHLLANELVKRGHKITVFSLYEKPDGAHYNVQVVRLPYFLHKLLKYKKAWGGIFFPLYVAREDFSGFDIIHAHGDSHFISTSLPMLRTFHGSGLKEALYATSWLSILYSLVIYPFEFISGLRATIAVGISKSTLKAFPFIKEIIYNGIDTAKFTPSPDRSHNPAILFVGCLDNRKRGRLLVSIFRDRIKKDFPDARLWLVCDKNISGDGIEVFMNNNISEDELIKLYQQAHIFCMPSTCESFGIPYVEAMASGTPVVTTANAGSKEILDNGKYGILTHKNLIAEALINLLKDKERRDALAIKGLQRAAEFSLDNMVNRYEKIYEELAGKRC